MNPSSKLSSKRPNSGIAALRMAARAESDYPSRIVKRAQGWSLALLVATGAIVWPSARARADFSAEGRKSKKKGAPASKPVQQQSGGGKPASGGVSKVAPAKPVGNDDADAKGPGQAALIARYTAIVLAQPAAPFPLQRLTQLYRDRDGNLKKLLEDVQKRADDRSSAESWNARVALAGLLKQEGLFDEAIKTYQAAIAERPKEPQAVLALAQLLQEHGELNEAKRRYSEALALLTHQADKEQTLRTLLTLSLDTNDLPSAHNYHKQLVTLGGGSLFLKAELGRELLARGQFARAEDEFQEVVKAATGDNRALVPALRDLGKAQAKQKKNTEAMETLKRALSLAGSEAGIRSEIFSTIADVYRADNNLRALIALLESEHPGDFPRLVMLGSLYEETGDAEKALATYRTALGANGKNIDIRLRVVRLLQAQGELDQAITENERLIQAAPRNPDYVFQLCETLLQRGDRTKALGLLAKLEQSAGNDEDVLTRVADFYERIDEKDRAMRVFSRLTTAAPNDPTHLADLGDRYWQSGDKKRAQEIWARIRNAGGNRAKALSVMGEVYLEHDMTGEALAVLKEAMDAEPQNVRTRKGYALALERAATGSGSQALSSARFDEARALWEDVLEKSGSDRLLAREARTHLVTLWSLLKQLEHHVEPLQRRLADEPPNLEAGRLLAEVQMRLRKLSDAEATLLKITAKAPGDEEAFLALERVRIMQRNLPGAIEALAKLAELNPKRAREYYQRMAQYSAELYRDDEAIKYASKAVALSPDDADGHRKLGEMYRRRQDNNHAIQEFRQAIVKNDRLFPVYMELAELLLAKGESDEADALYRRVIRSAPDEELVAQAGRLSMQRNLIKGSLPELENELLPLVLGNPSKRVYRRLLIELYSHRAFPLVQHARYGSREEAQKAREELVKIGARGVKPLLDALSDEQSSQVNTALDVLAYVENRGAGPTLLSFATGGAEQPLRIRAMIATGALRDPALLPRYEALLAPKGLETITPGDPISVAAAWSVARMGDRRALPLLEKLTQSGAPDIRALGAIGLGLLHDHKEASRLEALAKAPDSSAVARAAAAIALGELGTSNASPTLITLASASDPLVRSAALASLSRLNDSATVSVALPSLFAEEESERKAAAYALVAYANKATLSLGNDPLPAPTGPLDVREALQGLLPHGFDATLMARTLGSLQTDLAKAAAAAVGASPEQGMRVADALLSRGAGRAGFAPFTDGVSSLSEADRQAAEKSAEAIVRATLPKFAQLVHHPSPAVKIAALRVLEGHNEDVATSTLLEALSDSAPEVVRAALSAIEHTRGIHATPRVTQLLTSSNPWALRVLAAEALGVLAQRDATAEAQGAWVALMQAAKDDSFAFVREAALRSLVVSKAPQARQYVANAAAHDADQQLRAKANDLLQAQGVF